MKKQLYCAIIGGDKRMAYMAEAFLEKGMQVILYGLDDEICKGCKQADSLKEALDFAQIILAPLPLCKDGKYLTAKKKEEDLTIDCLMNNLKEKHLFFAGCIPEELKQFGSAQDIFMYDYMENEELTIFNTIATAEGAILEALLSYPGNLHGSRCLVTGFGRCAKTLAFKLQGLGAKVTICARKPSALAEAETYGYEAVNLSDINLKLRESDLIFNTVPNLILAKKQLLGVRKETVLLDIASAPGGIDYKEAEKRGLTARLCLGLPGKYAPKVSGEAMAKMILEEVKSRI